MSRIENAILAAAVEIRGLREAVEQLTDRISEAAGLWTPPERQTSPALDVGRNAPSLQGPPSVPLKD